MTRSIPWINFSLHCSILALLAFPVCQAKVDNVVLSSTEYSVTLAFDPDPEATNYTVWIYLRLPNAVPVDPPFNASRKSVTYDRATPGFNYTVELFETTANGGGEEKNVFRGVIATVPLPPVNVTVTARGSSFLFIEWDSDYGIDYTSHNISYLREDTSSSHIVQGTADNFFNLTELDAGFQYDISVQAVSFYPEGETKSNSSLTVSNYTLPSVPVNLTADALNTSHVSVTWGDEPDSNAESYRIEYYTQDASITQEVEECSAPPCVFAPGPPTGQNVTVIVQTISNGLLSDGAEITTSTEPRMINNLQVVGGVRSLYVTWSPPSASVVSFYTLLITDLWDNQMKRYTVPARSDNTSLSYLATQLRGGSVYRISVEAETNFATGKADVDTFYTLPEPVSNLKANAINTSAIFISWENPSFTEIQKIGINVTKADNDTLSFEEDAHSTTRVVTSLAPGDAYHVSVTVLTKTGQRSDVLNTTVNTKPVKPRLVSSLSSERELTVTVNRSVHEGVYDDFNLVLLDEKDAVIQNVTTESSKNFGSLVPGESYQLVAYTRSGAERSEPLSVTLYTRPRPPLDLTVDVVNSSLIHVEWMEPDEGGFDNFTVTVEESEERSQPQEYTTPATYADFQTVTAGTTYNVTVVTVKGDQVSVEVMEQNTTAPLNVKDIRMWVRGVTTVTLVWDPPVASGLDGYALTFAPTNLTLSELTSNVTQFKLEGLQPDTDYSIEIFTFALRPDGVKLFSPARQFNFSTYPESVAALYKVDATADSITVNWTAPLSKDFNLYQLGLREDSANPQMFPFLVPRTRTNHTFENLKPGQMYTVAIRTVLQLPQQRPRYGISTRLTRVTTPLPVMSVEVMHVNTSAVNVMWTVNETSQQNSFLISYGPDIASKTMELTIANATQRDYELTIGQLLSGTKYLFEVLAKRFIDGDSEESDPAVESGFTVPMPVSNLTILAVSQTLRLTWEPPSEGSWDNYQVSYRSTLRASDDTALKMTIAKDSPKTEIQDLFPGERYEVNVTTISNDLHSDDVFGNKVLDPLQPQGVTQDKDKTTTTSVTIGWSYNADRYFAQMWEIAYTDGDGVVIVNETASEKSAYSVELVGLKPGQTYSVKVKSVVLTVESDASTLSVTAKPVINTVLEEISTTTSSLLMGYTVNSEDIFDQFVFSVVGLEGSTVTKDKGDTGREVNFPNLQAGTRYTVNAITVSKDEESAAKSFEFITDPDSVPVELSPTAREITVKLGAQPGNIASHTVSCSPKNPDDAPCAETTKMVNAGEQNVVFSGLRPYTEYAFVVVTVTEKVGSREKNASKDYEMRTAEAAPSIVQDLQIQDLQLHSLTLTWKAPALANGMLRNYIISYRGREPDFLEAPVDQNIITVSTSTTNRVLTNLKAGYEYNVEVFARTVADGPAIKSRATLPTGSPAFKSGQSAESSKPAPPAANAGVTQTQLSLEFTNPFSSERGYVRFFTVIISKDPEVDDGASDLPSWDEARQDSSIKVYQAIAQCEDFFTATSQCGVGAAATPSSRKRRAANDLETRIFTLGAQTKEECQGVAICNGPLEENTEYYVKLRGYTTSGEFSETVYSEPIKTAEQSASNAGLIVGLVVGAIVSVVVVVLVVFLVNRRRQPKRATKHTGTNGNWEQSSLNKFSRVVKLAHFADHIRKMAADSDFKFAEEYEDLKEVGRSQPSLAAEFPPNRPKNRFTNILPYDHSRVKLLPTDDEEGSDYINANYMPGHSSKREYIATQGPLPATRDDFWRMLWEQGSRNIVMLTKCQEKGREKSDHYWPVDMEPKYYGDLQVVILAETPMPDWTVTELKVSLGDQSRIVRHFHYRSWPDFGVPQDPSSLIRFVRTVRERLIKEGGPIITHCSAGVGRSGTFIILDHLLQLIREKDEMDIFSMVYKLRKERVLMVQTEQQYKFIHECLLCVLENREEDTTYANVGQINIGYEDTELC